MGLDILQGRDIRNFKMLDFRVGRADSSLNSSPSTDFGIVLIDASGQQSNKIYVSDYALINGPASYYAGAHDDPQEPPRFNITFKTVRIPLSVFSGVDFSKIHSFRFIFDKTGSGALNFANIRLHKQLGLGSDQQQLLKSVRLNSKSYTPTINKKGIDPIEVPEAINSIKSIKIVNPATGMRVTQSNQKMIEITLASQVPFTVMDRLPVLKMGNHEFNISHYQNLSNLKEITFTLSEEQYQKASINDSILVFNGKVWKFGTLAKWQPRTT